VNESHQRELNPPAKRGDDLPFDEGLVHGLWRYLRRVMLVFALVLMALTVTFVTFLLQTSDDVNWSQILSAIGAVVATGAAWLAPWARKALRGGGAAYKVIGKRATQRTTAQRRSVSPWLAALPLLVAVTLVATAVGASYFLFIRPQPPLVEVNGTVVCGDKSPVSGVYISTESGNREGFAYVQAGGSRATFSKRVADGDPWRVTVGCGLRSGKPGSWATTNSSGYLWAIHRSFLCTAPAGSQTGTCEERAE
jgi:hypothetical protein